MNDTTMTIIGTWSNRRSFAGKRAATRRELPRRLHTSALDREKGHWVDGDTLSSPSRAGGRG